MSQNYRTEEKEGVHLIFGPPVIEGDDGKLETGIKSWLLSPSRIHIFDFRNVTDLKNSAYRIFVLFNQTLKASDKRLYIMNASAKLAQQIKQDGLDMVLVSIKNFEEAVAKLKPTDQKFSIDVGFITPFISATKTTLETQANISVTPGRPYMKKADENLPMGIAGIINLVNSGFTGSISVCFRNEVFLKIYENMVGEKHTEISKEIEDAAGEVMNIIFGQAKTVLNDQKGHNLEKALPTILIGEKLRLRQQGKSPTLVLPFESPIGSFHIEIFVERFNS